MDFVKKIIEICEDKDISINKMCIEAGITSQNFQNWKRGSQPTLDKVLKIIKYLNISADELFEINQEPIIEQMQEEIKQLKYDLEESRRESFMRSQKLNDTRFVFREIKNKSELIEKMYSSDRVDKERCMTEYIKSIAISSDKGEEIAENGIKVYKMTDYIE